MQTTEQLLAYIPEVDPERDLQLLNELDKKTQDLINVHLEATKEWTPDRFIPYDAARSYDKVEGWAAPAFDLAPSPELERTVRGIGSALFINTLTEDNLPKYHWEIMSKADLLSDNHPLREWGELWTYEESRHGRVMDGYLGATRLVDLDEIEVARKALMAHGVVPHAATGLQLLAYTTMQEKATQVAHNNTATRLRNIAKEGGNDYNGAAIMATVAGDEGRHHRFYGGLLKEALKIDPTIALTAFARELVGFSMPGKDIPGFTRHAVQISRAGIYGDRELLNEVIMPTLKLLDFNKIDVDRLSPNGQRAHEVIVGSVDVLRARVAKRNRSTQPS